jgi:alpha(1,3/1,4) fucosyltransferase
VGTSIFKYLGFLLFCYAEAKTLYIVPYPETNPVPAFYNLRAHPDESTSKWFYLREELEKCGYELQFTTDAKDLQDFDALLSITNINPQLLKNLASYPKERCFLFVFEPPVFYPRLYKPFLTASFGKIFVMFDDLIDNIHYFKFHYPQAKLEINKILPDFNEKKLCVLIAGNKKSSHPKELYSERKKAIAFFSSLDTDEFDLYGTHWEGYKNWKGPAYKKEEVLKNYRFCICYENMKDQYGYITEKIFDCFAAGCVPIYWGADNIADYIPKGCFIDRRKFASDLELYFFLKGMDEHTYQTYLFEIDRYLQSPRSQIFSITHFINLIKEHLIP